MIELLFLVRGGSYLLSGYASSSRLNALKTEGTPLTATGPSATGTAVGLYNSNLMFSSTQ